jgi:hypothetical protein
MIPIARADDDLFGTLIAATRLGRISGIIEHLRTRYDEEWDDPLAGLPYALAMLAVLQSGREDLLELFSYTEIIETLSDLLYHEPDHWLGRYLRIHTRTLIPDGEHPHYIAGERDKAVQDAHELIERQGHAAWRPWFACSYIAAARASWQCDQQNRDQVAELVASAAAAPRTAIGFPSLGSIMCSAFLWYHNRPELPERDTVSVIMASFFPDHPAVRRVRTDSLAGQAG